MEKQHQKKREISLLDGFFFRYVYVGLKQRLSYINGFLVTGL